MPKWPISTSKATHSIQNGITQSRLAHPKPQHDAFISGCCLSHGVPQQQRCGVPARIIFAIIHERQPVFCNAGCFIYGGLVIFSCHRKRYEAQNHGDNPGKSYECTTSHEFSPNISSIAFFRSRQIPYSYFPPLPKCMFALTVHRTKTFHVK